MKLYVGNIPYVFDDQSLSELFAPYGTITSSRVAVDSSTGSSKGYGFIEMDDEGATRAMAALDASVQGGRTIHVMPARSRT